MGNDVANEQTYDSAFWTCMEKLRKYIIPLVNEVFGERFTEKANISIKNNKHVVEQTDSSLKQFYTDGYIELSEMFDQIVRNDYNFECETWYDMGIAVRIEEYEAAVAMENTYSEGNIIHVCHPKSAVIFLRPNASIPEKFIIRHWNPSKDGYMEFDVPALKIQDYPVDEIFEKRLLLLLPFYAFQFSEDDFREMEEDVGKISRLKEGLDDINARLVKLVEQSELSTVQRGTLIRLIKRVFDKVALKYKKVTEGVEQIMGGYIIRTDIDEIYEQGETAGMEKGIEKGIEKGMERGRIAEYINLRREDGYTDEQIKEGAMKRFQMAAEEIDKYLNPALTTV